MMHTKFQGHQPFDSREDFLKFLPYIGMVAIFRSPIPKKLHMKFDFDWPSGF